MSALSMWSVGEDGLLIELPDVGAVHMLADLIRSHEYADRLVELIPAARTVMLVGPREVLRRIGDDVRTFEPGTAPGGEPRTVEIPIRYDGVDLDDVASRTGLSVEEIVSAHSGAAYSVDFFGFSPGLAYISGTPQAIRIPRRDNPRTRVPVGAVAIANEYTVIYPAATPGGWSIIGTLEGPPMWDTNADPPTRVGLGDRIMFRRVG
ncbi:KipI family sensor histidine kinase inhibitor [Antricoccus suffuscus]|uniref:KipI family sensor histidine kinase inhibitor n=1 Tax=Antricoccus suffuscus TaxID=1629062 RepID=A0A2T0ZW34_9ACTN|nr:carboxyltransferase domain-containing protein [Antricoccus suffuscus]PRZ40571.1 KipI family sensor histidine kinase inhibitor [Antricoccus suffuscus]